MKMDLRQLRYFVAVAEELHFGRAATRMHISQPPLSQQIRLLEDTLGTQLFRRNQRNVRLTHEGEVLLAHIKPLLARWDETPGIVAAAKRGDAGFLRVGFTAASAYYLIPTAIGSFTQRFPAVELALHEMISNDQVSGLLENRLDVGLMRPHARHPDLMSQKLLDEPLMAVLPAQHPLAARPAIDLPSLRDLPLISFTPANSPYLRDMVEGLLGRDGHTPLVVQRATQPHTLVSLVAAGLGVALVPELTSRNRLDGVVYRPLAVQDPPVAEMYVCWRKQATSTLLENFLASLAEAARSR
ncbi:MAG: LysR family transcriptional regulator [Achromobacter sp.]|jgi:DNA-binding transcriptional LysR family regulator|uniref:Hca operon transcriptional activator HcaR n=1 Tax=Achromobacter insuavis TaxID=1287735 RepID=A0A6J5B611_9BURK|nr:MULTISPECIES: LysR family transcriptional regulator [Achromobacter]MBN9638482.1 LysR family transcriptional regulator [Achromobacter sp.]CAB3691972.1 Hca operon transcriptional activator HcaR [Achromobacter insuavis]CUI93521.1 Hca operon transcriptional activator [Achromobacter sp. 2789STDY5608633]CUJ23611.1 Hca operon transcriptional activator [Achromobacter sp. 2789STDY5608628]